MNDFLNQVYFDNTVRQYLVVAAIIIVAFLAKRYIAHYLAGVIYNMINTRWKTVDKDSFKRLVARPLGLFLVVLVTVVALDKLTFPNELDFRIYHISFHDLLQIIGTSAIIITFFLFLVKCLDFVGLLIKDRFADNEDRAKSQVIFFFKDLFKVLLGLVCILLVLKYAFNYDVKGFITGLSIVGAAIALALKENLENLIASFVIFFDKPFTTGDIVKVNNISGTVEKIGLRSTRIRSDEKTYITVPNKQMADSILDNLTERLQRRYILKLEINTNTPYQKVQELINGLKQIVKKEEIQNSSVFVTEVASTAIIVNTEVFTGNIPFSIFQNVRQAVNLEALELLDKLDIEIAGKSTEVNINTQGPVPPPSKIL